MCITYNFLNEVSHVAKTVQPMPNGVTSQYWQLFQ